MTRKGEEDRKRGEGTKAKVARKMTVFVKHSKKIDRT